MSQSFDVVAAFQRAALEVCNRRLDGLTRDTAIAELGLDSVSTLEMVSYLEERLGIRIPDEALGEVRTLRDLEVAILRRLGTLPAA